ncbi:MAG: hypothetical protein R3A52_30710 [Polyangiales bacterium]
MLGRASARTPRLLPGLDDATPRVRAATATALRGRDDARDALVAARCGSMAERSRRGGRGPRALASASSALVDALDDPSVPVVEAALAALGESPADVTARLASFAEDARRASTLRRAALDAVAARCDASAAPTLERIAEGSFDASLPPYEQEVGHAALAALARVAPDRARAWIARMQANAAALAAVERSARGGCRRR